MSNVAEMVAWLRREIDTDKSAALAATPGPWRVVNVTDYGSATVDGPDALQDGGYDDVTKSRKQVMRPLTVLPQDVDYGPTVELVDAEHIARHDPQDVTADCDAKLQLVHAHGRPHECIALTGSGDHSVVDGQPWELWEPKHTNDHGPCLVLRLLAQGYRHRAGWRGEWAT